jgi:hypothetical protein
MMVEDDSISRARPRTSRVSVGSFHCTDSSGEATSAMTRYLLTFGLVLAVTSSTHGAAGEAAADRITLRDGSVVLGLVTSAAGPHGSVEFLVRRDWAEQHVKGHLAEWDRAGAATARRAIEQRRERLASWRRERERSPGVGPDDRIVQWIDREQKRLSDPEGAARTALVGVRLPRGEVRELNRQPAIAGRLLRLAWLGGVRDPEAMTMAELTDAVEARGFAADAAGRAQPASLDRLLPPMPEPDAIWLARRAATEIAIDSGLRFLRYQDTVLPDMGPGQSITGLNPAMALSELKRLLDPDAAQGQGRPDPLAEKLQAVAARGRIGAVVTRLEIAPNLDGAAIETTFWVRAAGGRWVAYGSRTATIRADDLKPDEGRDLAEDPQVKGAFGMVEALGLGSIPPELKQRSLRIGAATQKALGVARSAFNQDLDALMLPVLRSAPEPDEAGPRVAKAAPDRGGRGGATAPKPAPRRSMLGPQDR